MSRVLLPRHALRYLNDLYGTDYLGETMGVSYSDDFMGPLTMPPTLVRENRDRLEVTHATLAKAQTVSGLAGQRDGVLVRIAIAFTAWAERWFPDAFIFVAIAVVVVAAAALVSKFIA